MRSGAYFTKYQDKQLEKLLREFGPAVAKRPLTRAVREGQKIITAEAIARSPVLSGRMKRAITTRALKKRGREGRKAIAFATTINMKQFEKLVAKSNKKSGGSEKARFYPAFVELGTKHRSASEFFRTAFDVKQSAAGNKFTQVLDKAIAFIWKSGGKLTGFKSGE